MIRNKTRFAVERNVTPWNQHGIWNTYARCECKGEACLIARLLNDYFSANGLHADEQTRVVDTATGLEVTTLVACGIGRDE